MFSFDKIKKDRSKNNKKDSFKVNDDDEHWHRERFKVLPKSCDYHWADPVWLHHQRLKLMFNETSYSMRINDMMLKASQDPMNYNRIMRAYLTSDKPIDLDSLNLTLEQQRKLLDGGNFCLTSPTLNKRTREAVVVQPSLRMNQVENERIFFIVQSSLL